MPQTTQPTTGPVTQQQLTTAQIFDNAGLIKWWNYPGERFGQSFNGYPEYGTDFGIPYQSKVGSITPGIVVYSGNQASPGCQSLGYVVQISNGVDGLYHYQHLSSVTVSKGTKINVGDLIGYSGGLPADNCSNGPHIEVRWSPQGAPNSNYPWFNNNNSIWVDPLGHYIALSGQVRTDSQPEPTTPQQLANAIQFSPTANVAALLNTINILQQYVGPGLPSSIPDITIGSLDTGIPNIIQGFWEFYIFIVDNIISFFLNMILIILGVYIFFKLTKNYIDISTLIQNAGSVSASNRALQLAKAAL